MASTMPAAPIVLSRSPLASPISTGTAAPVAPIGVMIDSGPVAAAA
jgi:hypothetical protein